MPPARKPRKPATPRKAATPRKPAATRKPSTPRTPPKLTVAVTGPTGDIGRALLRALDADPRVGTVLGMARRQFDPKDMGLKKTKYRQGDVLDRDGVDALVEGADVVVHLAFIILGGGDETRSINLEGSRNVFAAAVAAPRVKRLVYTSSVAAYGFHADNPQPLTEDVPTRGTDAHYYSAQKAELEDTLQESLAGSDLDAYVFRPCIVAGPDALTLVTSFPAPIRKLPVVKPVLPDPGIPFQLVHHDDVASAVVAGVRGDGSPGVYNLAGDGTVGVRDLAHAFGWLSVPVPKLGVGLTAEAVGRLPLMPAQASWINAMRVPVVMDTARARRELKWKPAHDTRATLAATVESARAGGLL
ncbi:MAG: NAD-dependent epimerase/dehydratase family protein [Actinomycetota bacterium]|nr:NAD-dependent epimerase/dehydratase family protein [Actinomycetota bacterium]